MSTPFTVRPATRDDHPVFARLFLELGVPDPTPTPDDFADTMLPRVLVLCEAGEALGYVYWQVYGAMAHVTNLVVDPRVRGRGAGKALMDAARELAMEEGCSRAYLHVKRDNAAAIRLYERCGFQPRCETWALRIEWARIAALPRPALALPVFTPSRDDDAALATRFGIDLERLARFRTWPGRVFVALGDSQEIVAFAVFDPARSRAHGFCVARPELASLLLDALRAEARPDGPASIHFHVDDDRALVESLQSGGAEIVFEMLRMQADLR
jgi:GNAT superfamily N-acetyltransferase